MKRRRVCVEAVADACLDYAWRDDIDDELREILEVAHDTIKSLKARGIATAKVLEVVEAELAAMKFPLLGDQDPGMSL